MGTGGLELWGVGIGPGARLAGAATISGILGFGSREQQRDRAQLPPKPARVRARGFQVRGSISRRSARRGGASLTERALAMATPGTNVTYTRVELSFLVRISEIA